MFSENSVLLRHLTFDAPEHLRTVVQRRQAGLTKLVNNRIHILCLDDLNIDRDLMNEVAGEVNNLQATDIEMLIEKYGFDGGKRSSFGLTKVQEKRILDAFEYYDYWDVCDMDVSKEQVFAFLADQNGVVQSRATEVAKFLEDYAEAFDKACKPKANV